ncbi:MAG: hypothetical protein QHG99_02370 [Methanomicrobiales archaeon]|nr:hypothetical protein [Methanomicrobiales archaeon]
MSLSRRYLILLISALLLITGAWQAVAHGFVPYLPIALLITLIAALWDGGGPARILVLSLGTILAVLSGGAPAVVLITQILTLSLYIVMARDPFPRHEAGAYAILFLLIVPVTWLLLSLPSQIVRSLLLLAIASLISGIALLVLYRVSAAGGEWV